MNDTVRYVAEQVSHHPPIGALFADNENFEYTQHLTMKTRWTGNSVTIDGIGMHHLLLKKWGDKIRWTGVKTVVHNALFGKVWIDHYGDMIIRNETTGIGKILPLL